MMDIGNRLSLIGNDERRRELKVSRKQPQAHREENLAALSAALRHEDSHRDGTCLCAERPCRGGHVGADGGHCECGTMAAEDYAAQPAAEPR